MKTPAPSSNDGDDAGDDVRRTVKGVGNTLPVPADRVARDTQRRRPTCFME